MKRAALAALAVAAAGEAYGWDLAGGELVVGVGVDDVRRSDAAIAFAAEGRSGVLATVWDIELRVGVAGEIDGDGDFWLGAGPVALYPLGGGLRLEASVMPGYYDRGGGNDLGGNLQFRTEAGFSVAVTESLRVGVSFSHKSNAGLDGENPGVETVLARAVYAF